MFLVAIESNLWPAICSAFAATCSLIVSLVVLRIQSQNREDAVRPRLVLDGWSYTTHEAEATGVLSIASIRNVGSGPALDIRSDSILSYGTAREGKTTLFETGSTYLPILEADSDSDTVVNWHTHFRWSETTRPNNKLPIPIFKEAKFDIRVTCHDSHGRLHIFSTSVLVVTACIVHPCAKRVGDGVYLTGHQYYIVPTWRLKTRKFGRIIINFAHWIIGRKRTKSEQPSWFIVRPECQGSKNPNCDRRNAGFTCENQGST
ncbi:hypothetical protein VT84_19095 [Gemmata sp. SH-PL17]|nr:hypothetical protein VT84_19095 [Gemmata sp. SH-PL17]